MDRDLRSRAIQAARLMTAHLDPERARLMSCPECLDRMWQYPEPEHWMQYPLCEFPQVDGVPYCSNQCAEIELRRGEQITLF